MLTIFIDNQPYTVEADGKSLLDVCLSLGFNLPYFCWHPALHSVGACRQCAVKLFKDEADTRGRIVMACMTPAKDGARISIDDAEAVAFRKNIIEWLMVNHPHDCPVCDEGGECHLQDMTVMTGHADRRARFPKRTHYNQYLGPFVTHEMNRCIQCYRCVRFYRDYAGGRDFDVFGWHDHVYFGRHAEGTLESPFSGNLVEVCPTGVFTDKTLAQHFTRKWDLQTAPSICVLCGLGCNTIPAERYGTLRRIHNRYHGQVNGYFLCDRGRYGYEFVNSERRVREPLLKAPTNTEQPSCGMALPKEELYARLAQVLGGGKTIGIGSPHASLESNFALQTLVGKERFFHGVSAGEFRLVHAMLHNLTHGPARSPALQEAAKADAIFILGEDLHHTAPLLALALRQAALQGPAESIAGGLRIDPFDELAVREVVQLARSPFFIATPLPTDLAAEATAIWRAAPDDIARLGFAVAHAIDATAPAVAELSAEMGELASRIAEALLAAKRPLLVAGYSLGSEAVIQAAAQVAWALCKVGRPAALSYTMPACNSLGLALLGGGEVGEALPLLHQGVAETLILLETDLYQQMGATQAEALLASAGHVIALDALRNETMARADITLPAATFAEADGTLVNSEGRAQRFFQVFAPEGDIQAGWRWLGELMPLAGKAKDNPWPVYDTLLSEMAQAIPAFAAVPAIAPPAGFRLVGQRVARESQRFSGRTATAANVDVHEAPPPADADTPLAFSMEGYQGFPPAPLIPRFWGPGWNSVQAVNKFQSEVGGSLRGGDPGRRLLEPATTKMVYTTRIPAAFAPQKMEWLLLPVSHLFGSEPLSLLTPGVAERAPAPYVGLNAADAQKLGAADGAIIAVQVGGQALQAPLRILSELPAGCAALPAGLPGMGSAGVLPAWGVLSCLEL